MAMNQAEGSFIIWDFTNIISEGKETWQSSTDSLRFN